MNGSISKPRFTSALHHKSNIACGAKPSPSQIKTYNREVRDQSVPVTQKSARNNVALDFRRTFKNIQDAGIAEYARDREFQGVTVAAVDL